MKGDIRFLKNAVEELISRVDRGLNCNLSQGGKRNDGPRPTVNQQRTASGKAKLGLGLGRPGPT